LRKRIEEMQTKGANKVCVEEVFFGEGEVSFKEEL